MSDRHASLGTRNFRIQSQFGGAMIELLLIASITLVVVWIPLEKTIKSFNGDQIDAQELLNAYSSFNGESFEVTNLGPDGLLRDNGSSAVDSTLQNLASDLKNLTGATGFCAALVSALPSGGFQVDGAVNEAGIGCAASVSANQQLAFEQSLDPLGGLQYSVVVRNLVLYPEITAQYRTADSPNSVQ